MSLPSRNHSPVMEYMTVKQVKEYLRRKQSILVPIGVIEQHGYHLPLKTDAILGEDLGRLIGERADLLVAPVIYSSFSGGGLPGTINISPAVMSLVISDTLTSLAAQGFRNIYMFLCHGGTENATALDNSIMMLLRSNPAFENVMLSLLPCWRFSSGWAEAIDAHDYHAGLLETSLIMALRPDLVRMEDVAVDEESLVNMMMEHPDNYQHAQKIVDDPYVIARKKQRAEIQFGVMGHPQNASAEFGRQIINEVVENTVLKITELEAQADGVYKEVAFTLPPLVL